MVTTHSETFSPKPFEISFSDEEITKLNERIETTRWPFEDVVPDSVENTKGKMGWGPPLPLMQDLALKWRSEYSWKKTEEFFNSFDNFKVTIEDMEVHYIHHRSPAKSAIPIILIHGWPGTFHEFLFAAPKLLNPPDGSQAFHIVIPSQPGFTFSSPAKKKWTMDDTARIFDKLMVGLGYDNGYAAQGGDWGSVTARCLGALYPERCKAVHLNFLPVPEPDMSEKFLATLSEKDRARAVAKEQFFKTSSAYAVIAGLTPRTPAYALNDSPTGILAWLGEKMVPSIRRTATSNPNPTLTLDILFTTCTLYYLTGCIGTSFLPYAYNDHFSSFGLNPKYFLPNFAMSVFPFESIFGREEMIRKTGNCVWYKEEEKDGGHWAAWETPDLFAEHLREAFKVLWKE